MSKSVAQVCVVCVLGLFVAVQFLVFNRFYNFYSVSKPLPSSILSNVTVVNSNTMTITRWIMTLWSVVKDEDRTVFESKQATDILLLTRRLLVFSVRQVNQRLNGTSCPKWWVNPLTISQIDQTLISQESSHYNLTFEVEPGGIPFRSVVRMTRPLPNATNPYPSSELFLVEAERLDKEVWEPACFYSFLPPQAVGLCLCDEELSEANTYTTERLEDWNVTDPVLSTWPPNTPMSVPDYIRFSTMDLYLKSPSDKTEFCGPEVKMLLFISSAPSHFRQRQAIRNTFGNFSFLEANAVRLVFLFGVIQDTESQLKIAAEFLEFNDIVQADFVDSYHNLTLSHLSMYNWVVTYCRSRGAPMPQWLFKADDDFFLNIPLARRIAAANPEKEIMGAPFCGTKAVRTLNKYYAPRYMYAPDYYAGYVSGVAYLVRTDVLEPLLKASITTPIIHMDDAYVTGLLTREVGIRPQNSTLISYGKGDDPCDIKLKMSSYIAPNSTLEEMWIHFQQLNDSYCYLDDQMLKASQMSHDDSEACLYI